MAAALLLSGCGVPRDAGPRALAPEEVPFASPTDSAPAEPAGDREVSLGFVRDEAVVLSSRTVEDPRTPEEVLELLFAGPSPDESRAGLSTFLPPTVTVEDVELADRLLPALMLAHDVLDDAANEGESTIGVVDGEEHHINGI